LFKSPFCTPPSSCIPWQGPGKASILPTRSKPGIEPLVFLSPSRPRRGCRFSLSLSEGIPFFLQRGRRAIENLFFTPLFPRQTPLFFFLESGGSRFFPMRLTLSPFPDYGFFLKVSPPFSQNVFFTAKTSFFVGQEVSRSLLKGKGVASWFVPLVSSTGLPPEGPRSFFLPIQTDPPLPAEGSIPSPLFLPVGRTFPLFTGPGFPFFFVAVHGPLFFFFFDSGASFFLVTINRSLVS